MKVFNIHHIDGAYMCRAKATSEENACYAMYNYVSGSYPDKGEVLDYNKENLDRYILIGTGEGSNPFENYVVTEIK
jgi:hypothetical protein